jgi:hypothetical protein
VLLGARVVAAADVTVPVLAAARDLAPGTPLTADLVVERQVRLDGDLPYLDGPLPDDVVLTRPLAAGELLPASAVSPAADVAADLRYVTLAVAEAGAPPRLGPGDLVDVWVLDDEGGAALALEAAPVVAVPDLAGSFGVGSGDRAVVVAVERADRTPEELTALLARLVGASSAGEVALTGRPVGP